MSSEEARGCIVCFWHEGWGAPAFQRYAGLLFGLPLAVTSFNRYSRLAEALARQLLVLLVSFYFDDARITDWRSAGGSGQWALEELNRLLGTPFSEDKKQPMAAQGLFLGLDHDLSQALHDGVVSFCERLHEKMSGMIEKVRTEEKLAPGLAAKIYGLANFLEMGVYGRVGCGGLGSTKMRQAERSSELTEPIKASLELLEAVFATQPWRVLPVLPVPCERFVIASDAALESPRLGTGGFLMVWADGFTERREAFVADIPIELYKLWTPGDRKIAQGSCPWCCTPFSADRIHSVIGGECGTSTTPQP